MLGGFGAIRGMQDSIKMNRNQLKKHRKTAKELAELNPAQHSSNQAAFESDPEKVAEVRAQIIAKRKRERNRNAILLVFMTILGIGLISLMFV